MAEDKKVITIQYDVDSKEVTTATKVVEDNTKANKQNEEGIKSIKTQLREANQELIKSVQLYGETSAQAIKAAKGVADLKDQIGFAKDLSDNFNPDQKFKALGAATQIAATGMQGVTSGMALFGDESQDTEKMLLKVQAAMAFSDAISGLSNLGDQWKTLKAVITATSVAQKVNTAGTLVAATVQKAFTESVTMTSTGFKLLRGAIIATGIGALVVGVGMLIANFDKVKKVVLNLVPGLASAGDAIMSIVNAVTDFIGVTSESERAIDRQKSMAEKSLAQNEKYLKRHESTLTDAQKRELELRNAHFERVKEGEFTHAESVQMYKEAKAKDARIAQEKANQESVEAAKKANEKLKAERDKAATEEKAAREKAAEEKKAFDESVRAELGAMAIREIEQKVEDDLQFKQDQADRLQAISDQVDAIDAIKNKEAEDEIARDKVVEQAKQEVRQAGISNVESIGKNLQVLAGKNKAVAKAGLIVEGAVGLANIVSNTMQANAKSVAAFPLTGGMPFVAINTVSGALSAAAQIKAVATGLKAVGGGSAGSVPSMGGVASRVAATATPQVGFQQSQSSQIAGSINQANNKDMSVTAVVNLSDLNKAQTTNNQQKEVSSFGGVK